jgi:hypothetical protein
MINPELLEYVRTEVAKGRTREEIHKSLISGGGWSEDDISEAFKIVIPMQNILLPKEEFTPFSYSPSPSLLKTTPLSQPTLSSPSHVWQNLVFIILGLVCVVSWYFYRPQIISYWNSYVNFSEKLSANFKLPSFGATTPAPKVISVTILPSIVVKDCGTTTAPKLDVPSTYENNSVFSCLGTSAANCENAKGVLKDDFFPTVFEITQSNNPGSCNFKLSYPTTSTLSDITGKKLAGQNITCPLSIVKAIDNTKPATPKFTAPNKTDFSKYGSQIYLYGTLGLFIENNLDQNKINGLGCSGMYIDSVIASFQKTQN